MLNWLRAGRPDDRPLAASAVAGAVSWGGLMIRLGFAAEMLSDLRIWLFVGVSAVLVAFGLRDLLTRLKP